jgi:RNase P subunit RPR2
MVERDIFCRKCKKLLVTSFDEQYVLAGNIEIYAAVRAICGNCFKPFFWRPTEEYLDEIDETPRDIQRKILLALAEDRKGVLKIN